MKKLRILGFEIKNNVEALGSEFVECAYFIDTIYELFDDNDIEYPNNVEEYSDDQIDTILNLIYDNKDADEYLLGQLVYECMSKMK